MRNDRDRNVALSHDVAVRPVINDDSAAGSHNDHRGTCVLGRRDDGINDVVAADVSRDRHPGFSSSVNEIV